jgi:UDP-N-acetylglucosamine 1-carboxyvinyltransferase
MIDCERLNVDGPVVLKGDVYISGAKNASLPILAATILCESDVNLHNVPALRDVSTMLSLLQQLGAKCETNKNNVLVNANNVDSVEAPYDLVKTMRASILVLGPLLARYGYAVVSLPGGCAIGSRPVDVHLDGMRALGAEIKLKNGLVHASVPGKLKGAHFTMDKVSVTGTEIIMMAACLAEGTTTLYNSACEPEVVDLAEFLNKCGAKIKGAGTSTIQIEGVQELSGCEHTIMFDRIEAGTYLTAAAMTRGCVRAINVNPDQMSLVLQKLEETGVQINYGDNWVQVDSRGKRPIAVSIITAPYPQFPTDMQAQFMALNCVALGDSVIEENIYENRFMHAYELCRMGANIRILDNRALVKGREFLTAAPVMATDLRASASLVMAGLMAEGTTVVDRIYHLDRGYEAMEEKFNSLGALITRVGGKNATE